MEGFQTRGYLITTTLKYVREALPEPKRSRVLERISADTIRLAETTKPSAWYPVASSVEMLDAIVAANGDDEEGARRDLINAGIFAANEATNTFLKLLMKVLTPGLFAKKLPSLYERDNSQGKVTVEADDEKLVCRMEGIAAHRNSAPMALGWATFALERMGKELETSELRGWSLATPSPDVVTFELRWKT
jgi:hypothetical protein